jgi:SAM-dependent methyltransferase
VAFAVRYEPSREEAFDRGLAAITALGENLERFVFVDYGCGKGRALILAAGYPFRRIVGVEFAASLADVARENVATLGAAAPRIDVHTMDATDFAPPPGPLVLYFFNPFGAPVLRQILERVRTSIARVPRPVYLILVEAPRLSRIPAEAGFTRVGVVDLGRVELFRAGTVNSPGPARADLSS